MWFSVDIPTLMGEVLSLAYIIHFPDRQQLGQWKNTRGPLTNVVNRANFLV